MPRENRTTRRGGMRGDLSEVRKKGTSPSSSDSKKPSLWDRFVKSVTTIRTPKKPKIKHGRGADYNPRVNRGSRQQIVNNANKTYSQAVLNNTIKNVREAGVRFVKFFQYSGGDMQQAANAKKAVGTAYDFVHDTYVVKAFKNANQSDIGAQGRLQAQYDDSGQHKRFLLPYMLDSSTRSAWIKAGQLWMNDLVPKSKVDKYLLKDENGEETLNMDQIIADFGRDEAAVRSFFKNDEDEQKAIIEYYRKNTTTKAVFNIETGEFEEVQRLKADAELPFWVKDTKENRDIWTYYINYMDETFQVQYEAAENARKEREKALKYNYSSAWSDDSDTPKSLLDAWLIDVNDEIQEFKEGFQEFKTNGIKAIEPPSINNMVDELKESNTSQWFNEYFKNPVIAGKHGTFWANRLYGALRLLDAPSRLVRSFKAGKTEIGGHTEFEGQSAYWAKLDGYSDDAVREAQTAFMQNGGAELLQRKHPMYSYMRSTGAASLQLMPDEELEAHITEELAKQGITVPWTEIRDKIEQEYFSKTDNAKLEALKKGHRLDNLKKTLSTEDYTFDADTGNPVEDLILEFTSDPTLVFGGIGKSIAKKGTKEIATSSLSKGIKAVVGEGEAAIKYSEKIMADPSTKSFIKRLSKSEDGANIIFKNSRALEDDVDVLLKSVKEAQPELFKSAAEEKLFKDAVFSELMDGVYTSNARIISSTARGNRSIDRKALEFAYNVNKASDKIDTALLKVAFPEPFLISGAWKYGKRGLAASNVGLLMKKRSLKRAEIAAETVKAVHTDGLVVATENLKNATISSKLTNKEVAGGARYIKSQIDEASSLVRNTLDDVRTGDISIDSARKQIDTYIELLTNGEYKTIDELEDWAATLDDVYSREYIDALETLKSTKTEFDDFVDMTQSRVKDNFLQELDKASSDREAVREVFNKYVQDVDFLYLIDEINATVPNSRDFINTCIKDSKTALSAGLLADRSSVIKSIFDTINDATDVTRRTITSDTVKGFVNSTTTLKNVIKKSVNNRGYWYLEDVFDLIDTFDGTEYTYKKVYTVLDRAISNAYLYLSKKAVSQDARMMLATSDSTVKFADEMKDVIEDLLKVQDLVRGTDSVALDDVDTIATLHLDIMQATHNMLNDSAIKKFINETYNQVFKKPIEEVQLVDYTDIAPLEELIIKDLKNIYKSRSSIQLFNNFDNKLRLLPGMSEAKIYAIESALLGSFESRKNMLNEILRDPNGVWDYINETLYNAFGESKLNMESLSNNLQSLLSTKSSKNIDNKYAEELLDPANKGVRDWFSNIVRGDLNDAQNYADQQYLMILLTQPELAKKYNNLALSGEDIHILHVSSTGLNSSSDIITGIGYRKWVPIDDIDNITISDIKKIFDDNPLPNDINLKVKMSEEEIDKISHSTLKAIYHSDETEDVLRKRFVKMFGKTVDEEVVSEKAVLNNFFKMLHDSQASKSGKKIVINPYRFLVHDLESVSGANGFNIRMLNERAVQCADKETPYLAQYARPEFSNSSSKMTLNSLQAVRETMKDAYLTSEEFYNLERLLVEYANAQKHLGTYHSIKDFEGLYNTVEHLKGVLRKFNIEDSTHQYIKDLSEGLSKNPVDTAGMRDAIKTTNKLNQEAQSYFVRSGVHKAARLSSVNFNDAEYLAHLDEENVTAFQNIADMFGIELQFLEELDSPNSLGLHWPSHGNKKLNTSLIQLNIKEVDDIISTFMHELRHHWSGTNDFGSGFKSELRQKLLKQYDMSAIMSAKNAPDTRSLSDPVLVYISYIGSRYTGLRYSGLNDEYMEEFIAPLFQYYFTSPDAKQKITRRVLARGLETTPGGASVLDFMDNVGILVNNRTQLNEWEGLLDKLNMPKGIVRDAMDALSLRIDLQDEFIDSVINCLENIDNLRNRLTDIANSNIVRNANYSNVSGNVINVERQYSLDKVKQVFNLQFSNGDWFELSLPTVEKMSDFAEDILNIRATDITSYAEEVLALYKDEFDKYIQYVQDIISNYKTLSVGSSDYEFLQFLAPGSNATDSYLIARKIHDFLGISNLPEDDIVGLQKDLYDHLMPKYLGDGTFSTDMLDVLTGKVDLKIYKSGNISDTYAKRFHYLTGSMENELELARNYRNAQYDIFSHIKQREHASLRLHFNGIKTSEDSMIGRAYTSVLNALDRATEKLTRDQVYRVVKDLHHPDRYVEVHARAITRQLSVRHHELLQRYRFDRLKNADGSFNKDQLVQELLFNGFNHISFQRGKYSASEMEDLYNFVKSLPDNGIDFIKCDVDVNTDKLYIWLEGDRGIFSDNTTNVEKRYLVSADNKHSKYYEAPEYESLHSAGDLIDVDSELADYYIMDDIVRGDIDSYIDAWRNIEILTDGRSRGTSGRILSKREIEHYINTLPEFMRGMTSPKNLLESSDYGLVFDPGFIIEGETDYFLDMLDAMHYQGQVINQGTATMAYMFGNSAATNFYSLVGDASDEDILEFFSKTSDYAVYTLVPNKNYIHGVEMKQLRIDTKRAIEFARETDNAVILPYDVSLSVMEEINVSKIPNSIKSTFNKALIVMKAFQLCNIGSWVRNWYDATKKAAFDMGEEPSNFWYFLSYQGKAMRDIASYRKILKSYEGYIDDMSWDIIKETCNTDMTYQDYELLSNLFHSDNISLESKYFKRNSSRLISGEDTGVRGFSLEDFKKAYKDTYGFKASDELLAIHQHSIIPDDAQREVYDDVIRKIDTHLKKTRLHFTPDKAINTIFHPFSVSENLVRYAQTLYLRDFGMTDGQISKRIHLTQFNSRRFSKSSYAEYVIPYANYMYDNVMYWMRLMEENPRYFKYFENTYKTVANDHIEDMLDAGQEFDFNRDYMLKTGGIPLGSTGLYFKLNPSFFDFMENVYGGVPNFIDKLNPLLNIATRYTMSEYGLGSKYFFSDIDLNLSANDYIKEVASIVPVLNNIYSIKKGYRQATELYNDSSDMSSRVLFAVFAPIIGICHNYENTSASSFEDWQASLEKQGLWYDANKGQIVNLSEKNQDGANNPNNTFDDIEAYSLVHFGKVWDGNQGKFVHYWDYQPGGFNQKFDFIRDPDAWDRLCALYDTVGKVFDYNIGHFVYKSELSKGGLNDPNIGWDDKCSLMQELFNKKWDTNQQKFTTPDMYMEGGLNDPNISSRQKKALRKALFGQVWNNVTKRYEVVAEPEVVFLNQYSKVDVTRDIYNKLGIPQLANLTSDVHVNSDGLLVTKDGKYVITNNDDYNKKVFDAIKGPYSGYGRRYHGWKRYSYNKIRIRKPKGVRINYNPYQTGYGWNSDEGYYRLAYEQEERYAYKMQVRVHNSQPARSRTHLSAPHVHYPYGGGYSKFSFHMR